MVTAIESDWSVLLPDVKWIIFNYLDEYYAALYRCRRVCKDWKNMIEGFNAYWESKARYIRNKCLRSHTQTI